MTIEERAERAAVLKQSMNCCQAVVMALADETPLDEESLLKIASGFGSGMGNMEGTCGALVGAGMAAGFRTHGQATTRFTRQISDNFRARCGAVLCHELKGRETGKVLCSCPDCCRNAVRAYGEVFGLE